MKRSRNTLLLIPVVAGIVVFWLLPLINKAEISTYERYYEDTWKPSIPVVKAGSEADTTIRKRKKVYRKETLEPKKSRKLNMKMFSRATHFEPELVQADTVLEKKSKIDTVKVAEVSSHLDYTHAK